MLGANEVQIVRITAVTLVVLVMLGQPTVTGAQEKPDKPVVEKLKHGEINWTDKTVAATGSGAPDLKLPNVAAIRLNAERAAKIDAYRNIVETLKGIRITANVRGKQALAEGAVKTEVEGIVRGCKVADTHYYSDGAVDVVLTCPLDGGLATSLAPVHDRKVVKASNQGEYTGLIVDATGLKMRPVLQPRMVDGNGRSIYAAPMVAPNALRKRGAVAYAQTVDAAKALPRVGGKPLVIKAMRVGKAGALVVKDAAVTGASANAIFAEGRVVVVIGAQ